MPAEPTELRLVSLIASATEIVCALGLQQQLVGRSHECDFPLEVGLLPVCSQPQINVQASSREIDRQVRARVAHALSVYEVLGEELQRLQPTHVITQTQCEVCAVSLQDVERTLCQLTGLNTRVVSLEPMNLDDFWRDIQQVAQALGVPERGERLEAELKARLNEVQRAVASRTEKPRVLCLEWLEPLMSAGNWVPELVSLAGGEPVLCIPGQHSPYFSWEELQAIDPEVIAIMPCGFDIPRTLQEVELVTSRPGWSQLSAVRQGRVFVTDGNQYFNRPGPRLVESAEILAEILDPRWQDGPRRHETTGWVPLETGVALR
ncbi:cobalamin-binding protein [Planctomicrobium sp. SH664]|uniref:cobalamin-binding protein n=1 Tax=Planctomicrobium sp. SH664 TaxID=3448125 RepID=UPI003F5B46B4